MKPEPDQTKDELLSAMEDLLQSKSGDEHPGLTVKEIHEMGIFGKDKIRHLLRALLDSGRLEVVLVRRRALDGRDSRVPAYRIKSLPETDS